MRELQNSSISGAIVALMAILMSCNSNVMYTDAVTMDDNMWALDNVATFPMDNSDTISRSDISFSIRTSSDYPFRNIFLFVSITSPYGQTVCDTLEYFLADEKGNWYGRGVGDVHELNLPFKENVYFPIQGTYRFTVRHGMRVGDLPGVYDFGVRVISAENQ